MKKKIILIICLLTIYGFSESSLPETQQNPAISLNPQDVPIFYDNHPLAEMKSFTLITSFPLKDKETRRKIKQAIENTLKGIGEVIHLKDNDMQGFGSGNVFLVQMGDITEWNGNEMPASRVSLSIESSITIDKTGVKTFPIVWSINTFLQGALSTNSESTLIKATQKLVSEFAQNYQYANPTKTKRPVFYTYD